MSVSRVLRNILIGYAVLHLIVAGGFLFVLTAWLRDQMLEQTRHRMLDASYGLRQHILELDDQIRDRSLLTHLQELEKETGSRYTLINNQGTVVVDSRTGYQDIGDHGNRPEVIEARNRGVGFNQRTSKTLGLPLLYLAIPLHDPPDEQNENGFVRIAVEAKSVFETITSLQKFLWLFTIGSGALAALLMITFAIREMRPLPTFARAAHDIAKGRYTSLPLARRNDEWKSLADAFSIMRSELKQRETGLRENSLRLEAVLGSMIEGVLSVNAKQEVLIANQAACQMLGVDHQQLIGRRLFELVRIPELRASVQHTLLTQSSTHAEFETTSELRKVLDVRVTPLSSQRESGAAIVMYDVTELRNLETMRRDFVANVSHELKTPLASIKAYAETLRRGAIEDDENKHAFVKQIESQADLLDSQIADLLKLAEVESGRATFDNQQLDLNRVVAQCIDRFKVEADRRQVTIEHQQAQQAIMIKSDETALATILDNLVSNAIRYAKQPGLVTLECQRTNNQTVISVADNGIGISSEHRDRVFERFFRVDKARSRDLGGTGLGLAIVKHFVVALGGKIDVESKLGHGSKFTVTFQSTDN